MRQGPHSAQVSIEKHKIFTKSHKRAMNQFCQKSTSYTYKTSSFLIVNPRRHEEKKVTQRHEGGGGSIRPPLLSKVFSQLT